jgi:RNA polymerase-binding transcription factor DksA
MNSTQRTELQEIILSKIAAILDVEYHEPVSSITIEDVSARIAFKADPLLNELRLALDRLSRNEFGNCIFCKEEIPVHVLYSLPTAHFCERCANILRCRTHSAAWLHA